MRFIKEGFPLSESHMGIWFLAAQHKMTSIAGFFLSVPSKLIRYWNGPPVRYFINNHLSLIWISLQSVMYIFSCQAVELVVFGLILTLWRWDFVLKMFFIPNVAYSVTLNPLSLFTCLVCCVIFQHLVKQLAYVHVPCGKCLLCLCGSDLMYEYGCKCFYWKHKLSNLSKRMLSASIFIDMCLEPPYWMFKGWLPLLEIFLYLKYNPHFGQFSVPAKRTQ